MPRLPAGYHGSAGSWFGRLPRAGQRRPYSAPGEQFYERHRRPLRVTGQSVVNGQGRATVVAVPEGVGTRWYISQVQVATGTGPSDSSSVTVYAGAVLPGSIVGSSLQGGGDTFGVAVPAMQPGDLLTAVWSGANPQDTVSLTVYGDHEVLL